MQIWPDFSTQYGYIFQELYLPTQTTAASVSLDYQFVPDSGATLGWLRVSLVTDLTNLDAYIARPLYVDVNNYPGTAWQTVNVSLNASQLAALNTAHSAGQHVYLIIDLWASSLFVNVDNVAFTVSGSMNYPTVSGVIAYIGMNSSGYDRTVDRIDPDGDNQQTLWTHPSTTPSTNHILDVAWKPDASELAFSSNHESSYSAFHSDVYGIKPDGSGLRRITNPPSKAQLDAGGYQMGGVTGQVVNKKGNVTLVHLYVEGSQSFVSLPLSHLDDAASFTFPNVADLGTGLHYAVYTWSDGSNADCKEYAVEAIVDVTPGQTVDAGTLTFNPAGCYTYDVRSISWKRDGSQVGFFVSSFPKKVPAAGQVLGTDLFDSGAVPAGKLAWSPNNDQILYRRQTFDSSSGIYMTTAGGSTGTKLADDTVGAVTALYVTPAWLPDGSGFVYTLDSEIHQYTLASSQDTVLAQFYNEYVDNPSVSPDGKYVVFERISTKAPLQYNLWVMNRSNPAEMWPVTENGRSRNPDWSRQNPSSTPCTALTGVTISGSAIGVPGTPYTFSASVTPANATSPGYTWSPAPASGQGTANAQYTWATAGEKTVSVSVSNCSGVGTASDSHTVTIANTWHYIHLPLVLRNF
jgi:hypothetical protein